MTEPTRRQKLRPIEYVMLSGVMALVCRAGRVDGDPRPVLSHYRQRRGVHRGDHGNCHAALGRVPQLNT